MSLKLKTLFANRSISRLFLPITRIVCVATMAYYMARVVISGVSTIGAIMNSLIPVFSVGLVLLFLEHILQGNVSISLSFKPKLSKEVFKKILIIVPIIILFSLFIFPLLPRSPVHLILVLMVLIAAGLSVILMLRGQGVEALCVFILAWPIILFEQGGLIFSEWDKSFHQILPDWPGYLVMESFVCLLLLAWFIRVLLNRQSLVSATWCPGIWLFVIAGVISVPFAYNFRISLFNLVVSILMPVLFFLFCVNEIRSLKDFKKLSLALGVSMGLITLAWLYYALYRTPQEASTIVEFASHRGGGGKTFGSAYANRNGIYYEYLCPLALPSVLALSFTSLSKLIKSIWLSTALLMIGASLFTFGRIGWVVLLICLLPWFWHLRRGRLLFISLSSSIAFASFVKPYYFFRLFHRFETILDWEKFETTARYTIWKGTVQMFLDYPWTGVGVGMFQHIGADYGLGFYIFNPVDLTRTFTVWAEAHSTFFHIIATMGIFGLVAWSLLLWIPIRTLIRKRKILLTSSMQYRPWATAVQSYSLVLLFYLFVGGGVGSWGIETIRIQLFFLWLAVICNSDNFWRDYVPGK